MSALNITCAGAMYHGCSTLEIMRYRCPHWQPGSDLPINDAPEESEEAAEEETAEEEASEATNEDDGEAPASDESSDDAPDDGEE
ncbi:hypothetical protein ABL78_5053 [Leptomonas seymouri]|uniref:Uncharacterized protein n=1 Tax=Leptomonas seymouri TaxID=5684 RepID=A0A0N1I5I1_LEPSE|nr:hypothetical protein ABL78_5053 [Leptomonas seymouri]|eukprot:KPI85872.1 hypothetical protein ABL78_5053 [Leptomonas seymouri]